LSSVLKNVEIALDTEEESCPEVSDVALAL
jgi:hypothetical protein